jgi:hypothetical protein
MKNFIDSGKALRLEEAFNEAKDRYEKLSSVPVRLSHRRLKNTSMQAQPVINAHVLDAGKRAYRIDIGFKAKMSDSLWMYDLPHPVLVGWFAHELGHVDDYHGRSVSNLALFGIKYLLSPGFRTETERRADRLAIEAGFANDLIETKQFILGVADLNPRYKRRLSKYYYSPEDIEELVQQRA